MSKPITIVQGGQFGSESKGAIAFYLCQNRGVQWAVRTGSINAGHSVMVGGRKIAFQQLPVAAAMSGVKLVLGPGAYIHGPTLMKESEFGPDVLNRLYVDNNCGVHLDHFTDEATAAGRNLKIGATGKGCAEATIAKLRDRGVGTPLLFRNHHKAIGYHWSDTAEMLTDAYHSGDHVLLEGTQGTLLDLHTGPYPFVTSRQCISSAWVAEAGLSPALNYDVTLVVRTYPIRVAGNSGPMPNEMDWPTLARRMNRRLADRKLPAVVHEEAIVEYEQSLQFAQAAMADRDSSYRSLHAPTEALKSMTAEGLTEVMKLFETTTVTKRLRRVAELDVGQLRLTVRKEAPSSIALTFMNYAMPELAFERELHAEALEYIRCLEHAVDCPISLVSIGPRSEDILEVPHR